MFSNKERKDCFLFLLATGYGATSIINVLRRKRRLQRDILVPCFGLVAVASGKREVDLKNEGGVGMGPGFL